MNEATVKPPRTWWCYSREDHALSLVSAAVGAGSRRARRLAAHAGDGTSDDPLIGTELVMTRSLPDGNVTELYARPGLGHPRYLFFVHVTDKYHYGVFVDDFLTLENVSVLLADLHRAQEKP